MTAPSIKHALPPEPFPVPLTTPHDPLAPLGLRIDYRTGCQPWGADDAHGGRRLFTVAIDSDGRTDWGRVTCKRCNRPVPPTRESGETHA